MALSVKKRRWSAIVPPRGGHMVADVRQWLSGLDLARYADLFDENEVDMRDLPHVTEADLKELGLPLGPRKRAIDAIQSLGLSAPMESVDAGRVQRRTDTEAERRQVTVLFADITGFTALSTLHDTIAERARIRSFERFYLANGVVQ